MASLPICVPSPLLELVICVPSVDREGHCPYNHHHRQSSHKQHRVPHQHRQLGPQVAPSNSSPLHRTVHLVVVLAAEDAGLVMMVPQSREAVVIAATFVAKVGLAAVAGHVIAAGRPLDVDAAERALLAVGHAVPGFGFRPFLELLLASLELSARYSLVPGGVAAEAPDVLTLGAGDSHFVLSVALEVSRKLVLSDEAAIGAGLSTIFSSVLQSKSLVPLSHRIRKMRQNFISCDDSVFALRVGTQYVRFALVLNIRTHYLLDATLADDFGATFPLVFHLRGFVETHNACACAIILLSIEISKCHVLPATRIDTGKGEVWKIFHEHVIILLTIDVGECLRKAFTADDCGAAVLMFHSEVKSKRFATHTVHIGHHAL